MIGAGRCLVYPALAQAGHQPGGVVEPPVPVVARQGVGHRAGRPHLLPPGSPALVGQPRVEVEVPRVVPQGPRRRLLGQDPFLLEIVQDAVEQVALDLRSRSMELKRKAETQSEKATIEIVALMFQAILSEDRIPPAIRVWFARLQMPVLRVALSEPEFFGSLEHPARQLIDRMGSCVLGFDAAAVSGSAMETEIKRVVQVIEQLTEGA